MPLRTCSRSYRRDDWERFSLRCVLILPRRQTREPQSLGNIFNTEFKQGGNSLGALRMERTDLEKAVERADRARGAEGGASALQQLRNSVKHANVRVGGRGKKIAGDTRRSEERPLRDPSGDEHFRAKSVKHSWRCGTRPRRDKSRLFMQLRLRKKTPTTTTKQPRSVTMPLI